MKVFISWSGELSREVAVLLRDWLGNVIQNCEPWFSDRDIQAGSIWFGEISQEIKDTRFGILCITRENMRAPWVLWEAGAIYRGLEEEQRVVPLLIDMPKSDIEPPLSLFQAKEILRREDVLAILSGIGSQLERPLSEERLQLQLNKYWDELARPTEAAIKKHTGEVKGERRAPEEMIEEILEHVRAIRTQNPFMPISAQFGAGKSAALGLLADIWQEEEPRRSRQVAEAVEAFKQTQRKRGGGGARRIARAKDDANSDSS